MDVTVNGLTVKDDTDHGTGGIRGSATGSGAGSGDRPHAQIEEVVDQFAGEPPAGGAERQPVVRQQLLWDVPLSYRGRDNLRSRLGGFAVGDQGRYRHAGVVVEDLMDGSHRAVAK